MIALAVSVLLGVQEPSSPERLRKAIEDARREAEAERERFAREEEAQERELAQAVSRVERAAEELVDRAAALGRKQAALEELRGRRARLRDAQAALVEERAELRRIAEEARGKLSDLLDTLPPSEARARQKELLAALASRLEAAAEPADLEPLVELWASLLEEIHGASVFETGIRNAEGAFEVADVLRIGLCLFAARGRSSSGVSLAVAPPGDEKGYRWNPRIPSWAGEALARAMDDLRAGGGRVRVPLDVTQEMSLERAYGRDGTWAWLAAGGPVMIPIGGVAALALGVVLERLVFLSRRGRTCERRAEAILSACERGALEEAEGLAAQGGGPVVEMMAACLARREGGVSAMEDAVQEEILRTLPRLERTLGFLGVLAGVAPLLGLLGTVTGMMGTFDRIAVLGSGDPAIMAGGIYEALITTVAGLVVAIPVLLFHSHLSGRVDRILADMERFGQGLINRLAVRSIPREEVRS